MSASAIGGRPRQQPEDRFPILRIAHDEELRLAGVVLEPRPQTGANAGFDFVPNHEHAIVVLTARERQLAKRRAQFRAIEIRKLDIIAFGDDLVSPVAPSDGNQ